MTTKPISSKRTQKKLMVKSFISLIERSFPAGHKLRKIFNRNTIKLSYSCMPNVKQIIDGYNKAILKIAGTAQRQKDGGKTCSCRKKGDCPLNGESARRIIYIWRERPVCELLKKQFFTEIHFCKKAVFLQPFNL